MKEFPRGVSYYTLATCEIGFPEDRVACIWCPMLGMELKSDRHYCRKTGEYLVAPKDVIGFNCPLKFNKEDEQVG
jgi:hypothetical protein